MATSKTTPKKRVSSTVAVPAAANGGSPAAKTTVITAKKAAPVPAVAAPVVHRPKPKLVRDSFTIPKPEYAVLDALKVRAANLARPAKKSEVLRAGISALNAMDDRAFLATLSSVPSLKTGRPKRPASATSATGPSAD